MLPIERWRISPVWPWSLALQCAVARPRLTPGEGRLPSNTACGIPGSCRRSRSAASAATSPPTLAGCVARSTVARRLRTACRACAGQRHRGPVARSCLGGRRHFPDQTVRRQRRMPGVITEVTQDCCRTERSSSIVRPASACAGGRCGARGYRADSPRDGVHGFGRRDQRRRDTFADDLNRDARHAMAGARTWPRGHRRCRCDGRRNAGSIREDVFDQPG